MNRKNDKIIIATRKSSLAMSQANWVKNLLVDAGYSTELLGITTEGDRETQWSTTRSIGKSLFVTDIENALENGMADMAVHSLRCCRVVGLAPLAIRLLAMRALLAFLRGYWSCQ